MDTKIVLDGLDAKLDKLNTRFEAIEKKIDGIAAQNSLSGINENPYADLLDE